MTKDMFQVEVMQRATSRKMCRRSREGMLAFNADVGLVQAWGTSPRMAAATGGNWQDIILKPKSKP